LEKFIARGFFNGKRDALKVELAIDQVVDQSGI
jgi:hypothetical protein